MLKLTQLRAYLSNNTFEAVAEDAAQEFIQKGGKVTQLPYRKPRKSEKTDYGSKHIGGRGEHKSGKAANTQSPKVVGEEMLGEEDYDTMVDRMGSPSAVRRHFRSMSGASQSLDQTIARSKASSAGRASGKLYHKVPFHQKDEAKKEGMRWDSDARKWYHSSPAASSTSKFQKEEVEIEEALDFKKEAAKHMKDLHSKNSTPVNKEYAQKMLRRALEASKMKDPVAAKKHYTGVAEETELEEKTLTPAEMSKREEIAKAMERKHPGMDKAKKMAIATATAKRVAEESEQIDEISKATAKSYANKRSAEINFAPEMPFKKKPKDAAYAKRTAQGMISALKRMQGQKPTSENVEQVNELKKSTLLSYIKKASGDSVVRAEISGRQKGVRGLENWRKAVNRSAGIDKAATRLAKEETEQIDELNKDTLYSYKKKADADYETQGRKIGPLIRANDAAGANKAAARTNKRLMGMERAEKRLGEEADKTTHDNPLVTVHAGDKIHTHANLSTANSILGTSVKAADVHKGEVKTKGRDYSNLRFNISKHHQAALKESIQLSELTYKLLRRYKSAASKDASAADRAGNYARGNKRFSGIIKATKKQFQIGAKNPKATMDEANQIDEISQATTTSYVNKVVDPVYGMPRSTNKLKQRLAGLERIRQRTAKKYSEKSQEVKEEQDTNQMSPSAEKKAFIKIKPTRSAAVAKALK